MTRKMNPEVKAEWLKRLRSGEYTQGRQALRIADYDRKKTVHCCLGVLGEYAVEVLPEWNWTTRNGNWYLSAPGVSLIAGVLPPKILAWAGIDHNVSSDNEVVSARFGFDMEEDGPRSVEIQYALADRNDAPDDARWSFEKIADWIEENL